MLHVVQMTETKKFNWLGLVAVLGALFMMIGVFLNWATIGGVDYTGWDLYSNVNSINGVVDNTFAPLAVLIIGILGFLVCLVPIFKHNTGKMIGALALILSIIGIAVTAMLYMSIGDISVITHSVGSGLWVALVGEIILLLGSFVDIFKVHD